MALVVVTGSPDVPLIRIGVRESFIKDTRVVKWFQCYLGSFARPSVISRGPALITRCFVTPPVSCPLSLILITALNYVQFNSRESRFYYPADQTVEWLAIYKHKFIFYEIFHSPIDSFLDTKNTHADDEGSSVNGDRLSVGVVHSHGRYQQEKKQKSLSS